MADDTFAFDTVLPVQFFTPRVQVPEPERRLRLAVLEDALRYYCEGAGDVSRRARLLHDDAAEWFASPDRSDGFAFENVCDALGLDPDAIRRGLRRHDATTRPPTSAPATQRHAA